MTYRNMENIMKLEHLAPLLQAKASAARDAFLAQIERDVNKSTGGRELYYAMEHSDVLFKLSCEQKLFSFLAQRCKQAQGARAKALEKGTFESMIAKSIENSFCRSEKESFNRLTPETAFDVTLDDLVEWADHEFQYLSPLARSTSASNNLAEQYMLQTVMDFRKNRMSLWQEIRNAQKQDPEWLEWSKTEELLHKAQREKKAAAMELAEQRAEDARREVKKLVKTVTGPHLMNRSVFIGWPTREDAKRIRNDELRAYVWRVHDVYTYDPVTDSITKKVAVTKD